jgi:uncharacterized membrane protein
MSDSAPALSGLESANHHAASELLPLVYEELRKLAAHKLANEAPGQTLQATALVHEAWLRLITVEGQRFENRAHFFAAAAEAMRRILVDRARRKQSVKHGGGLKRVIYLPGASATRPRGINLQGDIVGHYVSQGEQEHGFLLSGGVFTTIDFPDADQTIASGINDNGDIAGYYVDGKDRTHGFVLHAGTFTTIDYPGASFTEAWKVNNSGQIAGRYVGPDGNHQPRRWSK